MRSIRLLAVTTGALVLGSACGDGGTPPTQNAAPVAIFTAPSCTVGVVCAFTADPSTDDAAVTGWKWDFNGDQTDEATTKDASFTFAAAGSIPVRLIVSDAEGLADTVTNNVPVAPATPGNTPPVASFELATSCVAGTPCGFHSTSVDPDGAEDIASWSWDFDDATPAGAGEDVTHTFAAAGTYTVTLTVTDIAGAPGVASEPIIVAPAASQDCTTSGTVVDCSFTPTAQVTFKVTVVSTNCELTGNRVSATAPVAQTVFFNLCNQSAGAEYTIKDGTGVALVFAAGTPLALQFTRGNPGAGDPPAGDPGIQVTGAYPTWTLNVDDGGAADTPGEPDFNDAVLSVTATAAP
jgi:PKD repeat protein